MPQPEELPVAASIWCSAFLRSRAPHASQAPTEYKASNGLYARLSLSHGYLNKKGYCNGNDCQVFPGTKILCVSNPTTGQTLMHSLTALQHNSFASTSLHCIVICNMGALPSQQVRATHIVAVNCLERVSPCCIGPK